MPMKNTFKAKLIAATLGLGMSLSLPSLALAAYNDVSLVATNAVLSVNSITLNISGSSATIESIVVNATTFVVTLQANSSFQVTAPGRNILATNQQSGIAVDTCSSQESTLGYTASSSEIIATITPSATLCSTATVTTTGSSRPSGGGGSGSTTTVVTPVVPVVVQGANAVAIAAIKTQLIVLLQQLIAILIEQLQAQIQVMQATGGNN